MGILDNLENSWNLDEPESKPIKQTDAMGRIIFWDQKDPNPNS